MSTFTSEGARLHAFQRDLAEHRMRLCATLRSAIAQASALSKPIIASYTLPAPVRDLADIFVAAEAAGLTDLCYWEQPVAHNGFLGIGGVARVSADGAERLGLVAKAWQTLRDAAVIAVSPSAPALPWGGPIWVGGFAFDSLSPRTTLWQGFPDGLLVLPRLFYGQRDGRACVTFNALVAPGDDAK